MDEVNPRKRPRPIVSCLRCRDKKLKCDRTSPCENCRKASCTETCTYNRDGGSVPRMNGHDMGRNGVVGVDNRHARSPTATNSNLSALEDLQIRMAKVEEMLGVRNERAGISIERQQTMTPTLTPSMPLGMLVVKGTRSVYHGQNNRVALLNQFLEVKDFINNEFFKNEELQTSAKQVRFLQNKSQSKIASPDATSPEFSPALLKLREFLPPKVYCDKHVAIYSRHFERTMRVLHIPTFRHQYEQIWANTNPDICTSSSIIPQVTAVLTMAYHMDDSIHINDDEVFRTYLRETAIELIQAWLDELDRKRRTELSTFQVEVLLLLSKSLRQLSLDKLWSSTGALVRSAMMMGLHVNSSGIPNITPYQSEMRRRLWATVLEIDIQASMNAGMPLVGPEFNVADLIPTNINDSDFDESTTVLPPSCSLSTQTDNIYQAYLAYCLPHRLKALSLVQRSALNMDEAVELGRKIEEHLSSKPPVFSLDDHNTNSFDAEGLLLHRVLLDLYIRRPLLYLYKPLLFGNQQDQATYAEIQKYCLESFLTILSYQDLFTSHSLHAITTNPLPLQNLFYRCCKNDILWAALSICQQIKFLRQTSQDFASLVRTVEKTIKYLTSRVDQKGSNVKDIVFLSLALQSVQLPDSFPERSNALYQSTKNALTACRERLMQTMVSSEQSEHTQTQPDPTAKRAKTMTTTTMQSHPAVVPSDLVSLFAPSATDMQGTMDAEQWFGDVPGLAAEFSRFQGELFDAGDAVLFGSLQDWEWEGMWQ